MPAAEPPTPPRGAQEHRSGADVPQPRGAHKVLNNNVVITVDPQGRERVLMGRGLGFQLGPDSVIDYAKVEKTFVLDADADPAHAAAVLTATPYPVVEAVTEGIEQAERALGRDLGRHVAVAIIDHVGFVLERLQKGVRIPAASMPELGVLYPEEFGAAQALAAYLEQRLDVRFPTEESVFLTTHLLNATRDEPNGTAALLFRRVQHVVSTIESRYGIELDTRGADYARFILHVKFLLQRLVSQTMLRGGDSSFYDFAVQRYPEAHACAVDVRDYVLASTGSTLTDEEMLYLIVHIERLTQRVAEADAPTPPPGERADAEPPSPPA